jgi:FkbM family methyltransferase
LVWISSLIPALFESGSIVANASSYRRAEPSHLSADKGAKPDGSRLRASAQKAKTNASNVVNGSVALHSHRTMPCQCDQAVQAWAPCTRTVPKCVFIDLGAADGNTLQSFLSGGYGPVANCPSGGQWEAVLVEANPRFTQALQHQEVAYPGMVRAAAATAAYMCEAQTTFYLDTQNHANNYWGSSMSSNHVDTQASGHQAVTVPTVNVLRLLYENTIQADYVLLKMDIEGAEWDVLPCLSTSNMPSLVDRLLVETHPASWGNAGTTQDEYNIAIAVLRQKGVDIPTYHSHTM